MEQGTFYFQYVPVHEKETRDPMTNVEKRLYLVYCKDLLVRDKKQVKLTLPKRLVSYQKDVLTMHFFSQVFKHAALKRSERNHTSRCQCQIQIDLQPKVKIFM